MKSRKLICLACVAFVLSLVLTGCTLPAFITPSETMYARYKEAMRSQAVYGYSLEIIKSVDADAYATLDEIRQGDAVTESQETIIATGSYNRDLQTFTANIALSGERAGTEISAPEHAQLIINGTTIYIDAKSMYRTYADLLELDAEYPVDDEFIVIDGTGLVESLWSDTMSVEDTALAFLGTFDSVFTDYLLEKATFAKEKNYAGVVLEDLAPQELSEALLQAAYQHRDLMDAAANTLLGQIISEETKEALLAETAEARDLVKTGEADPSILLNPAVMSAMLLTNVEEWFGMSDEAYAALKYKYVDNASECQIVQRYASDIYVLDTGYSKTTTYLLGTIHDSASAIPLTLYTINFVTDNTADTSVDIPAETINTTAVMDAVLPVFMNLLTAEETSTTGDPSASESALPNVEQDDSDDASGTEIELPTGEPKAESEGTAPENNGQAPTEETVNAELNAAELTEHGTPAVGITLPEATLFSENGNFSATIIEDRIFFGLSSAFISERGIKVTNATQTENASSGVKESIISIPSYDNSLASGTSMEQAFYIYDGGTVADYHGSDIIAVQNLCQPEAGDIMISDVIKESDGWNYCFSFTESSDTYHFYASRANNEYVLEGIHVYCKDVDVINEIAVFIIPNVSLCETHTENAYFVETEASEITSTSSASGTSSSSSSGSSSSGNSSSDSSTTTTVTEVAATSVEYGTRTYSSHKMWEISNAPDAARFGNTYSQGGYSTVEYTSYATINRTFVYLNDQYSTYSEDDLDDIYRNSEDMYQHLITWPLTIHLDEAGADSDSMSELSVAGDYTYRTASFSDDGLTRSIMIAVRKIDDHCVESLYLEVEGGTTYIEKFLKKLDA